MTGPVFVDTNVLVYCEDNADPAKRARARDWLSYLGEHQAARISFQVLQELYSTLTGKLDPTVDVELAQEIVRKLTVWHPTVIDLDLMEAAWKLGGRYSLSWSDALIVGAAKVSGCPVLLTEDLQHGQSLDGVRVVNPFASPERTPAEVLDRLTG